MAQVNMFNNYYCQGRSDWKAKKKKGLHTPQMSCFPAKISVKQWRSEKLQKKGHNFYIFLIVFLLSRTTLKLIDIQKRL